jgi:DNA repair protein SbcC/Rad50
MKFIHIADIHANKERKDIVLKILKDLKDYVTTNKVDFIAVAGDFWDTTITNTKASGFADIVNNVSELNKICPVKMIYGTAGHEANGSLDVFKTLGIEVHSQIEYSEKEHILWIPEPRKSQFIKQTQEETTSAIKEYLQQISSFKDVTLIVAHGEIEGASYDNGVICNSPICIPKSLLKETGAKYIAAGHIHTPQIIKDINCYYVGSPAPLTFGESHDGHFNVVTIDNDKVDVQEISFNFPVNITYELSADDISGLYKTDLSNKNVKIKLFCNSKINKHDFEKAVIEHTHCVSCKITPEYKNTISVRSKEILTQRTIVDKLKTYASVNDIKISQNALRIAHELEENMLIKYHFPSHSFKLLYASIKGAIGISKPKIELDFSRYTNGVIVMIGANGAGKTTILENLHPYPCMLTRSGKLRDHFYAHDSHRILVYEDETGKKYKITMQIVADIKTGSVKYYAETDEGNGWHPVLECDGNLDSYNKFVEETFGSLPLFMRTSFFTDKETTSCPDISKTTRAERLDLFSKLAGTDHFSTLCQITKDTLKELTLKLKELTLLTEGKDGYLKTKSELEQQKEKCNFAIEENLKQLKAYKELFSELRKKDTEYQKYLAKQEASRLLAEQYQKEISENNVLLNKVKTEKVLADSIEQNKDKIKLYEDFIEKASALKDRLIQIQTQSRPVEEKISSLTAEQSELEKSLLQIDSDILILNTEISHKREHISSGALDHCPTCGAKLSVTKQNELNESFIKTKNEIADIEFSISQKKDSKEQLLSKQNTLTNELAEANKQKSDFDSELNTLAEQITKCKETFSRLDNEGINKLLNISLIFSNHAEKIATLENRNNELSQLIKTQIKGEIKQDVTEQLKEAEAKVEETLNIDKNLTASLQRTETEIKNTDVQLEKIEDATSKIIPLKKEIEDYEMLSKAFSNTGIQALELEASIPNVIEVANNILHESYGDNFTINFSATHQGSTKVIEDFNITVFNSNKNREENLDNVSAGELVWIKQSLYYAFSVARQNNTGFCFLTRFMDESDGHLDSAMRVKYMQMINAAHVAGNASQTILVTHSQEIKDVAEQIIEI